MLFEMNLFTIFCAVLCLGIASAQNNRNRHFDCDTIGAHLNRNFTWTCQKRPCIEKFVQARTGYKEFPCDQTDNTRICCPELIEHEDGAHEAGEQSQEKHEKHDKNHNRALPHKGSLGSKKTLLDDPLIRDLQAKKFSKFDRDLLFELAKESRNKNIVVSPASVKSLLALLVEGSTEDTTKEILRMLQLKPEEKERAKSVALLRKLHSLLKNEHSAITLESQNRIYRAPDVALKQEYENTLHDTYNAGIEPLDFEKADQASTAINKWVKEVTHGLIPKVIEKDDVDGTTKLFLLNYIYLKANWDISFDPKHTKTRCFYTLEKECRNVKFMYRKRNLNYTDSVEHKAEIFEIPFKDPRYTIVFMLPHKDANVYDVLKSLDRKDLFELFKKLEEDSINLWLPRTVIDFSSNLVHTLQQLGMKSAFGRNAKLNNMLKDESNIAVSDIVHKARIEINEEGAEATGVSGANIQTLSLDVDRNVMVERPFLFFIRDTAVNGFLFEGVIFAPDRANPE